MNRGLYIGATSLVANQKKLDVLSNNLANVNTKGFKKDTSLLETFPEKLLKKINHNDRVRRVRRNEEFELANNLHELETAPAGLAQVGDNVYQAKAGNGYFVVNTPYGKSYVKEIKFTLDGNYLRTYYTDYKGDLESDNIDDKYPKKTAHENYIADRFGRPLNTDDGSLEELLESNIHYPTSDIIGSMSAGVNFQKIVIDFSQGDLIETGGKFDLALSGPGFFQVQGEDGRTYYTRDGSFTLNNEGNLSTLDGREVLGQGGLINIATGEFEVLRDGTILVDGENAGRLNIVDIENREFLRKIGDNVFDVVRDENGDPMGDLGEMEFTGQLLQGYLEESNVNAIGEMVEMISLLRDFEAGQKAIRVQDEMLEKASNEIGRV